ncbi:MAG: phosphoribosylanthranilate isomerase [Pseudanabaena sp. ELA607]|jgi:phosphoribosylanthranilate isomerase
MRVKVCGIRSAEDAKIVASLGADAIGILVGQKHHSDDFVSIEVAQEIIKTCPPYVSTVLVTHLDSAMEIISIANQLLVGLSAIQIHSECSVEAISIVRRELPNLKLVKNFHVTQVKASELINLMTPYEQFIDGFILDSVNLSEGRVGGTGLTHDWSISKEIVSNSSKPVILAGGLNSANVAEAIRNVNPFGVDANSGLKRHDGFKDATKVADYVREAKAQFFRMQ